MTTSVSKGLLINARIYDNTDQPAELAGVDRIDLLEYGAYVVEESESKSVSL